MEWPINYHSKGRPRPFFPAIRPWSLAYLALIVGFLNSSSVAADSSPPVADVEDLFKDEGFLRMSRGGEAFGRRPPPPPLILNPPHLSTQPPPRHFQTPSPHSKEKGGKATGPPMSHRHAEQSTNQGDKKIHGSGVNPSRNNSGDSESQTDGGGGGPQMSNNNKSGQQQQHLPKTKPLEKDSSAVFSKVGSENSGASSIHSESESDAHPLLGITPAAPGDPFDFNPILSNPAVTRILAGSSGRIPMWEPSLPDLHDLIEVNYTTTTGDGNNNRNHGNSYNPNPGSGGGPGSNGGGHGRGPGTRIPQHDPKNPVFVPSPVSSNRSPTMYKEMNMDQLTNNIAIPKHTLPNPSNLATSRSTLLEDGSDGYGSGGENGHGGGSRSEDRERDDRFSPNGGIGLHTHLEENRGGDGAGPYSYDEEESGPNEESGKNYLSSNGEAQGKRGIYKETGQDSADSRDENGPKYIGSALSGAWKHQCKLMGILFSIAAVLCVVFAIAVLYSLHFRFRDFVPFSLILLFLFTTSASRAFILLTGSFCSPDSRPLWLPIVSTLPASLFSVTILVALQLARFPVPFVKTYTIPCHSVLILSLFMLVPPLVISLSANFYPSNHTTMSQVAWIVGHVFLALIAIVYLLKFKAFYSRLSNERGASGISTSALNSCMSHNGTMSHGSSMANGNNNLSSSLKKRGFFVKWGCLPARAMFGASILALSLSIMIIISVSMNRGESDDSSTWTGWVLSLCARMLEFAIVILLLLVTISSADIRLFRLSRTQLNKSNVGLMNADIYPTMVSSNTAVQRCIPMCSSNTRADVMTMGGPSERTSLRGKTFGERALPGERMGEYRSSVGRGLPLRLGNGGPSHSLPGTPVDGFSQGLRLPEPAPASLLVTKVVFGTPAVSREVNLNHGHENPLLCTSGLGSKDDRDASNNIYASLESVKVASMANAGSSTGSNHSGSDRVLLSAGPRDYIYSISRDLTKTIDSIYDTSRPRMNNMGHNLASGPPLAHTIEQIGSIPNLNGGMAGRPPHFNFHQHNLHHGNGNMGPSRTDLARTIDRIRYSAATAPSTAVSTPTSNHPGRNFVLQLNGHGPNHLTGIGNPPPYCSSESSHDVTPDSGIVSDIHSKSGRMDIPEVVYAREYRRNSSIEDIRRLPILPLPKQHRPPGSTPLYDRTPTSPTNPICVSNASVTTPNVGASPIYIPNPTPNNSIVGRVEHLLNQTEHILSRTESLDSNSHSAGLQRLLSHKEQLEHVERLLAQAEYAIWLEKRNCAQQVSQVSPNESSSPYGYSHGINANTNSVRSPTTASPFPSANSAKSTPVSKDKSNSGNNSTTPSSSLVVTTASIGGNSNTNSNPSNLHATPNGVGSGTSHFGKKISKNLEEESVV